MTVFVIQTILLIAVFYILGCLFGVILRRLFSADATVESVEKPKPVEVAPKPVVKVVEPVPAPVAAPAPKPAVIAEKPKPAVKKAAPIVPAEKDDLKRIRGIGPQNEMKLNNIGVTTFAQVAAWSTTEQREIGDRLAFPGRIEREEWVDQAKILASGGETAFAKRVDAGEVSSSTGKASAASEGKKPATLEAEPADGADKLELINGVGSALERKLYAIGIFKFSQVAQWNSDNEIWIGNELGFPGRPQRENWVESAKSLAAGGTGGQASGSKRGDIKPS